ncbi:MAG: sigma-70 family RNA polymerase sigma factor [Ferruginibacter sp.]
MQSKGYQHIEDSELLQRYYKDNDNEWLGILLQRYTLLLLGVCMKYLKNEEDAKDSVQQVFLKVMNDLPKYKVTYFKSWLYMVAKNYCLMKLRKQGLITIEINEQVMISNETEDGILEAKQKDDHLHQMEIALNELNTEQKLCVTLFYLQKKTYQQIADNNGFSVMQVKSYIQNGKRNLKIIMLSMSKHES